ncbi:MAG: hypothetical protein ACPGNV_18125 [Mangrovicoccus sp.]
MTMTLEQIRSDWARWMHRADLDGDLDTVQGLALDTIRLAMRDATLSIDDVVAGAPSILFQAGLGHLCDLINDAPRAAEFHAQARAGMQLWYKQRLWSGSTPVADYMGVDNGD